jgi:hypothetical protein
LDGEQEDDYTYSLIAKSGATRRSELQNDELIAALRKDMEFLAGSLPHRASNSERELQAAQYIRGRLAENVRDIELQPFSSPESFYRIFAAYYAEYMFVCLIAIWLPWPALLYGTTVFIFYLFEFWGFGLLGRFLPHSDSQNVKAILPCESAQRLIVITAHYDTGLDTPLSRVTYARGLQHAHWAIMASMVLVIVSCTWRGSGLFEGNTQAYVATAAGWFASLVLMSVAGALVYCEAAGEEVRGACANASGTCAMMALAERLSADPMKSSAVWFVATGSKESWVNGMRKLLSKRSFSKRDTFFINLDYVGHGRLRYAISEGMLGRFYADARIVEAAERTAGAFEATPIHLTGLPTDCAVALSRGLRAMTITATDDDDQQPLRNRLPDTLSQIEWETVAGAVQFAEAILRDLDRPAPKAKQP